MLEVSLHLVRVLLISVWTHEKMCAWCVFYEHAVAIHHLNHTHEANKKQQKSVVELWSFDQTH